MSGETLSSSSHPSGQASSTAASASARSALRRWRASAVSGVAMSRSTRIAAEPPGGARGAVRHLDAESRLARGLVNDAAPLVELAGRRQQEPGPALPEAAQHARECGRGGGRRRGDHEDEIVAARGGRRRLARERVVRAPAEPGEGRRDRGGQMQLFQCGHGCLG